MEKQSVATIKLVDFWRNINQANSLKVKRRQAPANLTFVEFLKIVKMCFLKLLVRPRPIQLKQIGKAVSARPVKTLASLVPVFGARFRSTEVI